MIALKIAPIMAMIEHTDNGAGNLFNAAAYTSVRFRHSAKLQRYQMLTVLYGILVPA